MSPDNCMHRAGDIVLADDGFMCTRCGVVDADRPPEPSMTARRRVAGAERAKVHIGDIRAQLAARREAAAARGRPW